MNCIRKDGGRLIGHNTDKAGFIESLTECGLRAGGKAALILGVGGSARAVCVGLIEAGIGGLTLAGRRPHAVMSLANHLKAFRPGIGIEEVAMDGDPFDSAAVTADLVVNCTPIGMQGTGTEDESPFPAALMRPDLWICDLVYRPPLTTLLSKRRLQGRCRLGGPRDAGPAGSRVRAALDGEEPPVDIMRAAARSALGLQGYNI